MEMLAELTPQIMLVGLTIALMEAIKHYINIPEKLYFIPVMLLVVGLNYLFVAIGVEALPLDEAIKTGFIASGLFGLAKPIFVKQ